MILYSRSSVLYNSGYLYHFAWYSLLSLTPHLIPSLSYPLSALLTDHIRLRFPSMTHNDSLKIFPKIYTTPPHVTIVHIWNAGCPTLGPPISMFSAGFQCSITSQLPQESQDSHPPQDMCEIIRLYGVYGCEA